MATLVPVVTGESKVVENVAKQPTAGSETSPILVFDTVYDVYIAGGAAAASTSVSPPVGHDLQTHYEELLRVIAEVGKDVKPAYTNSKISADRLKRSESGLGTRLTVTWNHDIHYPCLHLQTLHWPDLLSETVFWTSRDLIRYIL